MASDPRTDAALALHRFGFGPRSGSIAAIASDPRGAVLAELDRADARIAATDLLTSVQASRAVFEFRAEQRAAQIAVQREAERKRAAAEEAGETGMANMEAKPAAPESPPAAAAEQAPTVPQQIFRKEARARIDAALGAEIGVVERLVWFWSNHFCISADAVPAMVGGYEREAIRPHVLGRFADMLLAVEGHPAMLSYLNNAMSIGPNSIAGLNRNRGLNENLAREILELHTLGVRGGYTQDDVIQFAYVLTGWTIIPFVGNPDHASEFVFNRRMHEPGAHSVLGKKYPEGGMEQGRAVLADLARHPATATHVATKLARHFVADQPPEPLVERLAKTFRDTDGDLKQVSKALVTAPEAWAAPRAKLKRPSEWIAASLRATGSGQIEIQRLLQAQFLLGEPLWRPPAPKGFADDEASWIDGMAMRLDIANAFAGQVGETTDPRAVLDEALGPLASADTRQTIARAESRVQALALLLMAPEFQRR